MMNDKKVSKELEMTKNKSNRTPEQQVKRDRRAAENVLFDQLSSLIPAKPGFKLDKTSILRFVVAYMKSRHIVEKETESVDGEMNSHDVSKEKDNGINSSDLVPKADVGFDIPEGVVSQLHEQFLSETDSGNEQIGMFVDSYKDALERGMRDFLAGTINHSPKASDDDEEEEEGDTPDDVSSPAMKNTSSVVSTVDTFSLNPVVIRPQTIVSRHGQSHDLMNTGFATKEGWLTLKASHGLMLILDNDLIIAYVSDNVSDLLGHQAEKMLGQNIKDYMDPNDAKELDRLLKGELINQGSRKGIGSSRRVIHFVMRYSFCPVTSGVKEEGYVLTQWSMKIQMKQNHVNGPKVLTSVAALCEVIKPNINYLDLSSQMFVIVWSTDCLPVAGEWDKVLYFTGYSSTEYKTACHCRNHVLKRGVKQADCKQILIDTGKFTSDYIGVRKATGERIWIKSEMTLRLGKDINSHQIIAKNHIVSEKDMTTYMKSYQVNHHGPTSISRSKSKRLRIKQIETESDKGSFRRHNNTLHISTSLHGPETVGFPATENVVQNNSLCNSSLQEETFSGSDQPSEETPFADTNSNHSSHFTDSNIQDRFDGLEFSPKSFYDFSPNFRGQEVFNLSQPVSSVYSSSDLDDLILSELQTEIHADEESPGIHDSMSDNSVTQTLTSLLSSDISPSNQEFNAAEGTTNYQQSQTEEGLNFALDFNLLSESDYQLLQNLSSEAEILDNPDLIPNDPLHNCSEETFSGSGQASRRKHFVDTNSNCSCHNTDERCGGDSDIQHWLDCLETEKSLPDFSPNVRDQEVVNSTQPLTLSPSSDLDDLILSDLLFFNPS